MQMFSALVAWMGHHYRIQLRNTPLQHEQCLGHGLLLSNVSIYFEFNNDVQKGINQSLLYLLL